VIQESINSLFEMVHDKRGGITLLGNKVERIQTVVSPDQPESIEARVAVKVESFWDGEPWYRCKPGVFIDGDWYPIVCNKDRQEFLKALSLRDDFNDIDNCIRIYDGFNLNCEAPHALYSMDQMTSWLTQAREFETKFKESIALGTV